MASRRVPFRAAGTSSTLVITARRRAVFEPSADAPARARRWLAPLLTPDARQAGVVAVSEIVTNALVHSRLATGDRIEVQVAPAGGERLRVSVRHRGRTFPTPSPPRPGQIGGWGLHLVQTLTVGWGVVRSGAHAIVVWFEL